MVPTPTLATTRPGAPMAPKHSPPELEWMDRPAEALENQPNKKAVVQPTVTMFDHPSGE